jgi:hypothetical protein
VWLVKPAIVVGVLWYLTRGASAAPSDVSNCPPGTLNIPFLGCTGYSTTTSDSNPGIGVTVVKTTSECDPSSPIYDPARCVATAGVQRVVPVGKNMRGVSPGVGLEPILL